MQPLQMETRCQAEHCWKLLDPPVPSPHGCHGLRSLAWARGLGKEFILDVFKFCDSGLAGVAQLVGASCHTPKRLGIGFPVRARAWVSGSIPSQGVYERQPTDVSISHSCFFLSLFFSF